MTYDPTRYFTRVVHGCEIRPYSAPGSSRRWAVVSPEGTVLLERTLADARDAARELRDRETP